MKLDIQNEITERIYLQTNKGKDMVMTDEKADALGDIFVAHDGKVYNCDEFNRLGIRHQTYYQSEASPWESHQSYVEIQLPNPAVNMDDYQRIRNIFLGEIKRIIEGKPVSIPA